MKKIILSKGQTAIVNDDDYEYLSKMSWHTLKNKTTYYACHGERFGKKMKSILMHRLIMKTPKGMETDHMDGNGLNNQKSNLRVCTISENRRNQTRKKLNCSSKFKGVSWNSAQKIWVANLQVDNKHVWLGRHHNEIDAAKAYDNAAREYFKEFACLNFS